MLDSYRAHRRFFPRLGVVALTIGFVLMAAAHAAQRSYWIEDFTATITVDPSSDITVVEQIRFRFDGSFQGIYRDIPLRYSDNLGFTYRLRLTVIAVTDDSGDPLRYEVSNVSGGRRRIRAWVPGAQDAARTVRISYRVQRAIRYFPEHDELYWNVTGNDWGVPIESASARIVLPGGLEREPRVTAYVGAYGSRSDDGTLRRARDNEVEVRAGRQLDYGEGLTVVVGWEKDVVHEPGPVGRAGWLLRDNWPLAIPILVFGLMLAAWRRYGRDPDIGRSVMPIYHPPANLSPAELGALIDERVDQRDIVATVVDLAVRGYLRIEEETDEGWFRDQTTITFVRLKPADDALKPHEREVHAGLFESGDRVTIEDLENEFYERLDTIRDNVYAELVSGGFFRRSPHGVRAAWFAIGAVVAAAALPLGAVLESVAGAVACALSGAIILGFAWFMPARTRQGVHKWVEAKGFEEFLGRTEGDRLREMEVDVGKFEAFLPFAMAFGVAEQWGRAFEEMLRHPPDWYAASGSGRFSPAHFSRRMGTVSRSVGAAMATAPRSSSGSSGFSGGSSGGGFGGGGGGAF